MNEPHDSFQISCRQSFPLFGELIFTYSWESKDYVQHVFFSKKMFYWKESFYNEQIQVIFDQGMD